jgi:hypothetical protein
LKSAVGSAETLSITQLDYEQRSILAASWIPSIIAAVSAILGSTAGGVTTFATTFVNQR